MIAAAVDPANHAPRLPRASVTCIPPHGPAGNIPTDCCGCNWGSWHKEDVSFARSSTGTIDTRGGGEFNATLKRAWAGLFHWFSIKHTDRYLHGTSLRWDARTKDTDTRLADLFTRSTGRLRQRKPLRGFARKDLTA